MPLQKIYLLRSQFSNRTEYRSRKVTSFHNKANILNKIDQELVKSECQVDTAKNLLDRYESQIMARSYQKGILIEF